jgi:hypothetical protein
MIREVVYSHQTVPKLYLLLEPLSPLLILKDHTPLLKQPGLTHNLRSALTIWYGRFNRCAHLYMLFSPQLRFTVLLGQKKTEKQLAAVAQAYYPSYLGSGDWEDHDSRPAQAKS